jgi:hypothetical protein
MAQTKGRLPVVFRDEKGLSSPRRARAFPCSGLWKKCCWLCFPRQDRNRRTLHGSPSEVLAVAPSVPGPACIALQHMWCAVARGVFAAQQIPRKGGKADRCWPYKSWRVAEWS